MRDEEGRRTAGLYRKIEVRMWGDERFGRLSPIAPSGQALWLYLLTGPHTGPIPGLFKAGRAGMAEELGWDLEAFDKAFAEVFAEGMAKADFKARFVWLPNAVKINPPASPNVVTSWRSHLDLLPECPLKLEATEALRASVFNVGEAYGKAFDKAFSKPSEKASPKPCPNQEQDKEEEQEEKKDAAPPPDGGVAHRPVPKPESSRRSTGNGGSKPPGGGGEVVEPDDAEARAEAERVLADPLASDEDRFFALKPRLAAKGVRWSMAMMIAKDADGDYAAAFKAVEKALGTRDPTTYLGGVTKGRRVENEALNPGRSNGKKNGVPGWVAEARDGGIVVQPDGPNRWRRQGEIYDDEESLIGW